MVNLEINEVTLAHCNMMFLTVAISKIQEFCIHLVNLNFNSFLTLRYGLLIKILNH